MKALEVLTESRRRRPNDAGFTLMELLIVISIMLILMLIAIPNMLNLKATANETSAQAVAARDSGSGEAIRDELSGEWLCLLAGGAGRKRIVGTAETPGGAAAAGRSGRRPEGRVHFNIVNCQKAPGNQQDNFVELRGDRGAAGGGQDGTQRLLPRHERRDQGRSVRRDQLHGGDSVRWPAKPVTAS